MRAGRPSWRDAIWGAPSGRGGALGRFLSGEAGAFGAFEGDELFDERRTVFGGGVFDALAIAEDNIIVCVAYKLSI
jgi:hypothetical protein